MMNKPSLWMAWAQKETSREVSWVLKPNLDLNHWRFSSMREISAMGASQIRAASSVKSSKTSSGTVSSTSYSQRILRRWISFLGSEARMDLFWREKEYKFDRKNQQFILRPPRRFAAQSKGRGSHHPHLHGVHNLGANGNRTDDHDRSAGVQPSLVHQVFQCHFNRVLWIDEVEGHDKRRDAPAPGEFAGVSFVVA